MSSPYRVFKIRWLALAFCLEVKSRPILTASWRNILETHNSCETARTPARTPWRPWSGSFADQWAYNTN